LPEGGVVLMAPQSDRERGSYGNSPDASNEARH
jgi:hypothetical protein